MEYRDSIIPVEIVEKILKEIRQPLKLIKLQLVSKEWMNECEKLFKFLDWKKFCTENIDKFALYSNMMSTLLEVQIKNYEIISDQKIWKKVFDSYLNWRSIQDNKLHILSTNNRWTPPFIHHDEEITCLDVWSSYTAVGTNKGNIFMFFEHDLLKPHYIIKSSNHYVETIKFWYTEFGKLLLIRKYIISTNSCLKFWDVEKKTEISTLKQNISVENFCVGSAHYFYGMVALYIFRFSPSSPANREMTTFTYYLSISDNQNIRAMSSFESKTYILICGESSIKLFTLKDNFNIKKKNNFEVPAPRHLPQISEVITQKTIFHVFTDETIICIGKRSLHFLTNDSKFWTSHDMYEIFVGKIKSLAFHANILLLGLDQGKLYMYDVNSPKELQAPDFFKRTTPRIIKLNSDESIINLKVGQISGNPSIIATTEKNIWAICTLPVNTSFRKVVHSDEFNYYYY